MKYSYGPVGAYVKCEDCDWKTESYKNGQAIAAKHARKYKHRVSGHVVNSFVYDGREEEAKQ